MAVKLSKSAKNRIKRMSVGDRKKVMSASRLLADTEIISSGRNAAVFRAVTTGQSHRF